MSVQGKAVLVTGGTSGIGEATARAYGAGPATWLRAGRPARRELGEAKVQWVRDADHGGIGRGELLCESWGVGQR